MADKIMEIKLRKTIYGGQIMEVKIMANYGRQNDGNFYGREM